MPLLWYQPDRASNIWNLAGTTAERKTDVVNCLSALKRSTQSDISLLLIFHSQSKSFGHGQSQPQASGKCKPSKTRSGNSSIDDLRHHSILLSVRKASLTMMMTVHLYWWLPICRNDFKILHILSHLTFREAVEDQQLHPTLKIWKLRNRKVNSLAQGHLASKKLGWDWYPSR